MYHTTLYICLEDGGITFEVNVRFTAKATPKKKDQQQAISAEDDTSGSETDSEESAKEDGSQKEKKAPRNRKSRRTASGYSQYCLPAPYKVSFTSKSWKQLLSSLSYQVKRDSSGGIYAFSCHWQEQHVMVYSCKCLTKLALRNWLRSGQGPIGKRLCCGLKRFLKAGLGDSMSS